MSAIATNGVVPAGGSYFMISRLAQCQHAVNDVLFVREFFETRMEEQFIFEILKVFTMKFYTQNY